MTDTVKNKKKEVGGQMGRRIIYVLLHNIRSSHNVGSVFRTSDAFGVSHIAISGYTPAPVDRFGKVNDTLVKVALGAEGTVSWKKYSGPAIALREFKRKFPAGKVVALEQSKKAVFLGSSEMMAKLGDSNVPVLLILGNEVDGVSSTLLRKADLIVEIAQVADGIKESLNVSVATGVALYELGKGSN